MENVKKYINFLLVEKEDESLAVVISPSCAVNVGHVVEFDNGVLGRVVKKAWGDEQNGELHDLVASIVPTYDLEAVYYPGWKREVTDDEELTDS